MEWGACFMGFLCLVAFEPRRHFDSKTNGFCDRDIFDEREGDLSSPGYPHRPPTHAVSCRYNISVKSGYSISLNFSDKFHIESAVPQHDAICPYHWLRVTIPGREPIKLCGDRSPGVIDTNSSRVSLDYRMDGKGLSRGWSLHFSTRKVQCPHPGRVANGRGPSSLAQFFYGDRIFVRCHQGHKVMMGGQLLESFSTTCQENGQWRDRLPDCKKFRCREPETLQNGWMKPLSGTPNEYLSVIQYGCDSAYSLQGHDNVTFTCEADGQWRSNTANVLTPFCTPVCGQLDPRVPNEDNVIPKDGFPWQAFVVASRVHASATVIGDRWLLTAAHVAHEFGSVKDEVQIVVGAVDLSRHSFNFVDAASFHVHPDFRSNPHGGWIINHDIALIKLREPLTFNETVRPLCLPTVETLHNNGTVGIVLNAGLLVHRSQSDPQDQLDIDWTALDDNTCHMLRDKLVLRFHGNVPPLPNSMFCARPPDLSSPMCHGLSGTPFTVKHNGSHWAVGIFSSWAYHCSDDSVRYFTKVLNYIDWIRDTMQKNS